MENKPETNLPLKRFEITNIETPDGSNEGSFTVMARDWDDAYEKAWNMITRELDISFDCEEMEEEEIEEETEEETPELPSIEHTTGYPTVKDPKNYPKITTWVENTKDRESGLSRTKETRKDVKPK